MQFTILTSVLVACMTVLVSASPIPVPVFNIEAREILPREPVDVVAVARAPEAEPEPICTKYSCV
ncbi:hypothetical protein B0H34DRAFT_859704 [Crassisporium funariophilum]|nr:hypothetical protein B0H34DRAFT_859704 [Crassisporium funariophilum]